MREYIILWDEIQGKWLRVPLELKKTILGEVYVLTEIKALPCRKEKDE